MMNATKGEGRALRERKPVTYNLNTLEAIQCDSEALGKPTRRSKKTGQVTVSKEVAHLLGDGVASSTPFTKLRVNCTACD